MRRRRPEKRKILPDPTYKDYTVAKFINYIMKNGKKSIAEKIFYDSLAIISEKEKKDWLEDLIHPLINDEIRAQIKSANSKYVVLSSALLLETRQKDLVDIVVVVDIPETLQIERTTLRDRNS